MRAIVESIEAEFRRYKKLAEGALAQLTDSELDATPSSADNSVAVIVQHVGGNLRSRFTDFLASDGEKPWRDREREFEPRGAGRDELMALWEGGWTALAGALAGLDDGRLGRQVVIRGQPLTVIEALHRALAHVAYHVGQIVFVAKGLRGADWSYLSIPPGRSDDYNRNPTLERPPRRPGS
jgi:hypothetical protein